MASSTELIKVGRQGVRLNASDEEKIRAHGIPDHAGTIAGLLPDRDAGRRPVNPCVQTDS